MQEEKFKTWIEFYYKDYEHRKFLLTNNSCESLVSEILKKRLEKNRRDLLKFPQNLPLYIVSNTEEKIPTEKIIEIIEKESATFQKVFSEFETEEKKYLESHSIN